jgi:hypothetical protein
MQRRLDQARPGQQTFETLTKLILEIEEDLRQAGDARDTP